jgi:hypothetical protein
LRREESRINPSQSHITYVRYPDAYTDEFVEASASGYGLYPRDPAADRLPRLVG